MVIGMLVVKLEEGDRCNCSESIASIIQMKYVLLVSQQHLCVKAQMMHMRGCMLQNEYEV
jgi:hypothetical protein